ncbi:MAG: AbrB/MazE/SpoVT family DNA-binding domain-containing protein [Fimbriimonadaceae bacterium]
MKKLKVTQIGNSAGVILPKDVIERLGVKKGDSLYVCETPHGYNISKHDPEFETQMEIARQITVQYANALRELAK